MPGKSSKGKCQRRPRKPTSKQRSKTQKGSQSRSPKTKTRKTSKTKKKSTTKSRKTGSKGRKLSKSQKTQEITEYYGLTKDIPFNFPDNLVRKGNFLVWVSHPWVTKSEFPGLAKVNLEEEAQTQLADKTVWPSIRRRAKELSRSQKTKSKTQLKSRGEALASRTRGWSLVFPRGKQRIPLVLLSPETHLIFELVPRKTWGPHAFRVIPKFPIVQKLPREIEERILNDEKVTEAQIKRYIKVDPRGLNAAYNRARQHENKYGKKLVELILKLQKHKEKK